ncbi:hypothetical protein KJ807_01490 [Patescibacteria group bacterium]|nr:hypothetical protein [Patescibacteria group bacterium]
MAGLANQANAKIQVRFMALRELSQTFNNRLKSAIITYITSSPGRFESDENKGLSAKEFENFRNATLKQVDVLIAQYAPTEKEIAAKKAAQSKLETAKKSAKAIEDVKIEDIKEDPGDIKDLPTLAHKFQEYSGWNASLQNQASKAMKGVGAFQKQFQEFKQARNGLKAYKKFADLFATGDPETQNLMAIKEGMVRDLKAAGKKLYDAQKKLDKYGKKMGTASNKQKQEKIEERDKHLARIEKDEKLSKNQKAAKKAEYLRLSKQKDTMTTQRDDLVEYHKQVETTKAQKLNKIEEGKARQGQLGQYNDIMQASLTKIDKMLDDPKIAEPQKEDLRKTRKQIAQKASTIQYGKVAADTAVSENEEQWKKLNDEEQRVGQQTYDMTTHIEEDLEPTIGTLDRHIGLLGNAMIQYTDSKEEVMKHYGEAFKVYDGIDASVDSSIMQNSLANQQLLDNLSSQILSLHSMTMDSPSVYGATIGAVTAMAGGVVSHAGEWLIDQSVQLNQWLANAKTQGMNPAAYWASKILLEVVSAPIGVAGGLAELGGGLLYMAGNPGEAAVGIGALLGRNPQTGEWWDGTGGKTWETMGKAMVSWDHFKKGEIGIGIGKFFVNVVTTVTGAGAVGAGGKVAGQAAKAAIQAAKLAGKSTANATARGIVAGTAAFGKEAALFVGREFKVGGIQAALKIARAPGGAKQIALWAASKVETLWNGTSADAARMRHLARAVSKGGQTYEKFNHALAKLSKQYPHLDDAALRLKLRHKNPILHAEGLRYEKNLTRLHRAAEQAEAAQKAAGKAGEPFQVLAKTPDGIHAIDQTGKIRVYKSIEELNLDKAKVSPEKLRRSVPESVGAPTEASSTYKVGGKELRKIPELQKPVAELNKITPDELAELGIRTSDDIAEFNRYKQHVRKLESAIDELRNLSAGDKATLDVMMHRIGANTNAVEVMTALVKGLERSLRKALLDYNGNVEKLLDLARGSLVFDGHADMYRALQMLKKNKNVKKMYIKDNFGIMNPDGSFNLNRRSPHPVQYRDFNLTVELPNGSVVELQMHLKPMLRAKEAGLTLPKSAYKGMAFTPDEIAEAQRVAKRIQKPGKPLIELPDLTADTAHVNGHKLYELARSLPEKNLTPVQKALKAKLDALMTKLYDSAWDGYKTQPKVKPSGYASKVRGKKLADVEAEYRRQPDNKIGEKSEAFKILATTDEGILAFNQKGQLRIYKTFEQYKLDASKVSPEKLRRRVPENVTKPKNTSGSTSVQ